MVVWIEKRCCKHIVPLYIAESLFCGVHILGLIFTSILVVGGINCQTVGFLCCVMTSLIRDGLLFLISTFYLSDDGEMKRFFLSIDSVHSESYGNHAQDMKSAVFFGNPDFSISAHSKISQSTVSSWTALILLFSTNLEAILIKHEKRISWIMLELIFIRFIVLQMPIPYAHSDSYFSGLFTAYGPHTLVNISFFQFKCLKC